MTSEHCTDRAIKEEAQAEPGYFNLPEAMGLYDKDAYCLGQYALVLMPQNRDKESHKHFFQHGQSIKDLNAYPSDIIRPARSHSLSNIIAQCVLATIGGANTLMEICEFGHAHADWLHQWYSFARPNQAILIQVLTRLNPTLFRYYFEQWRLSQYIVPSPLVDEQKVSRNVSGDQVRISSRQFMLHQPELFKQSYHDSQVATWLREIEIQDSVVLVQGADKEQPETLQAMVLNRQAQYIEAVNEQIAQSLSEHFTEGERVQFKHRRHCHKRLKQQQGDVHESRRYSLVEAQNYPEYQRWPGLRSLGRLIIKRSHHHESTEQTLYFLTSLDYQSIDRFIEATKDYGSQTDQPQSVLTIHFKQDDIPYSSAYTAKNIANLKTLAWKRLKKDKNRHYDINIQRKHAGWNYRYLLSLLRDSD